MRIFRFMVASSLGLAFFLLPVPSGGRVTVPFDLVVQWLVQGAPALVGLYCLALILWGALRSTRDGSARAVAAVRLMAVPLAIVYLMRAGPELLTQDGVAGLMWNTLAYSVAVIIPIGAALLVLFVEYGFLDFVGTLMEPIMRPLFRLPGRSALDSLTSWVGSYSVGLYLTRKLMDEGFYTRREAFTIVTCFSTVSIGFVAVVAQTLDLLYLFPWVFGSYFVAVYVLAIPLARVWPAAATPNTYVVDRSPEEPAEGHLLRVAWSRALTRADEAPSLGATMWRSFADGLVLASSILGSILTVGTAALLLARETNLFTWLGAPLVPVLALFGIPDAETVAPAVLVGIAEMYIPALLVEDASTKARFFIAVLSISQLIFFSSVGPMILDLFRAVPIRARQLVALFAIRTVVLVPLVAVLAALLEKIGVLQ